MPSRSAKFDNIITCVGTTGREWSPIMQLTEHGFRVLSNTDLFCLSHQDTMNNGNVVMGRNSFAIMRNPLVKNIFKIYIDYVISRWGVRPESRNGAGLVVAVVMMATVWFMQLVLTATTTLVAIAVVELTKRSYRFGSDARQN